ncbi:MAG: hypothetical protein V2A66_08280 [Pseudomonadota bacterium]
MPGSPAGFLLLLFDAGALLGGHHCLGSNPVEPVPAPYATFAIAWDCRVASLLAMTSDDFGNSL